MSFPLPFEIGEEPPSVEMRCIPFSDKFDIYVMGVKQNKKPLSHKDAKFCYLYEYKRINEEEFQRKKNTCHNIKE